MKKHLRRLLSLLLCFLILLPAGWAKAAPTVTESASPATKAGSAPTEIPSKLSRFALYNNGRTFPGEADGVITTSAGALKLLALEEERKTVEKTYGDLYNADNYSVYGNSYTKANFSAVFEESKITTGNIQSKLRLKDTSGVSDFHMGFTVQKITANALYAGASFRLQDDDFRSAPFGTRGYMVFLNSAKDSTDVTITLRRYTTATAQSVLSSQKAVSLLSAPLGAVKTELTVKGTLLTVTICDAANPESSYTAEFNLRPDSNEYYSEGSIAFVSNGDHAFTDISLTAVTEALEEAEKPVYGLMEKNNYTVHGNQSTLDNFGVAFGGDVLSTAGQSKIMLNHLTDIEDFEARFSLTKTNGNVLYGGIAFHVQNGGFTAGTFGGPGYLLFAQKSSADSMDVTLNLRNYLTADSYVQTTVAEIEGLLAAPTDGVTFQVKVVGDKLTVTLADAVDQTRVSEEYQVSLRSQGAKAGNYTGGSIAFVSNGSHAYSDISLTQIKKDRPYIQVENFTATADFTLRDYTTIQQGIVFYVQQAAHRSPGLSGYALNLIRTTSSADHELTAQLVLYGTNSSGAQMVNLGAIKTQPMANLLTSVNGGGETVRLTMTVIRGMLTFRVTNLSNEKVSQEYTIDLAAATNQGYTGYYESGSIGYFTNVSGTKLSGLTVTKLHDCKVSFDEYTGGKAENDGVYSYHETVTVKATADNDYYFVGWYNGNDLVSIDAEYSFVIEEDMVLTPVFASLPIRYAGISKDGGFIALKLDSIDGVESTGFQITVRTETGETSAVRSTGYVEQQTAPRTPYIATAEKVYYADVDNDGKIDSGDLAALRRYLVGRDVSVNMAAANVNEESACDVKDVVRLKMIFGGNQVNLDGLFNAGCLDEDYIYPFAVGDLLSGNGKAYVELVPYAVVEGQAAYGAARYLTCENGAVVHVSGSANHTPFGSIRIACIGDSITKGIGASNWQTGDYSMAYPQQMGRLLGDGYTVENYGIGSSYVCYYEGRDAKLWYPNTREYADSNTSDPDIVIIKLGTNDARAMTGEERAQMWETQFEELIRNYQNLESHPQVYVVSCLTMQLYNEDLETNLKTYILPRQKKVAENMGCVYLDAYTDLYEYFISGQGFAADKLHPNDAGYAKMAEYISGKMNFDIYY